MGDSKEAEKSEPNRRAFVVLCAAGTCAAAATIGVPAALFVAAPLGEKASEEKKIAVTNLSALSMNVPTKVAIVGDEIDAWTRATGRRLGAVWLIRTGEREVKALSTICPHLGCSVELSGDARAFVCPCHTSVFGLDGARVSGPSPRAMDPLPVEIGDGDVVLVTPKHFRIGVSSREEIG